MLSPAEQHTTILSTPAFKPRGTRGQPLAPLTWFYDVSTIRTLLRTCGTWPVAWLVSGRPFSCSTRPARTSRRVIFSSSSKTYHQSPSPDEYISPLQAIPSMTSDTLPNGSAWTLQRPPPLPAGYDKHHIVFLEAVHLPLAKLPFNHTIDAYPRTYPHEIAERIKNATIVISNVIDVKPSDMDHAPNIQLLAILATGMAWVDKPYCAQRGISVVNAPSANLDAVSEHFLALYFASRKRIGVIDHSVKSSDEWLKTSSLTKTVWPSGPPLGCKQETLGIIGYGALGKKIESLVKGVGFAEVLLAERRGASEIREGRTSLEEVLKRSSTIVLVCPKTPDTVNLIDERELKAMRKDALLVNIARGGIVNEAALAKALKEGRIFGAATDVLDTEPNGPGGSPLLPNLSKGEQPIPNLLITSHVAWFSGVTIETLQAINRDAMTAFVEGRMYDPTVKACVAVHDGKIWK